MRTIPLAVFEAADSLVQKIDDAMWEHDEHGRQLDWGVARILISDAIMEERKRCSLIAKSHGAFVPVFDGEQFLHVVNAVAEIIAKDILNSSTVPQAPLSVDEKSRDAALPSVSALSSGQE